MTPEELLAHRRQRETDAQAEIARLEAELVEARKYLVEVQCGVYAAEDAVLKAGGSIR